MNEPTDILTADIPLPTQAPVQVAHVVSAGTTAYRALVADLAAVCAERDAYLQTCQRLQEQVVALKAKLAGAEPTPERAVPSFMKPAEDLIATRNGAG